MTSADAKLAAIVVSSVVLCGMMTSYKNRRELTGLPDRGTKESFPRRLSPKDGVKADAQSEWEGDRSSKKGSWR